MAKIKPKAAAGGLWKLPNEGFAPCLGRNPVCSEDQQALPHATHRVGTEG